MRMQRRPVTVDRLPSRPAHLNPPAAAEWRRIAKALQQAGVLTGFDRAALAAYCQAWGRWVEAEEKLRETPPLIKTPSGYVQQSPWIAIANKQLELMGRYMVELGLTPAARSRVAAGASVTTYSVGREPMQITRVIVEHPRPSAIATDEQAAEAWLAKHGGE